MFQLQDFPNQKNSGPHLNSAFSDSAFSDSSSCSSETMSGPTTPQSPRLLSSPVMARSTQRPVAIPFHGDFPGATWDIFELCLSNSRLVFQATVGPLMWEVADVMIADMHAFTAFCNSMTDAYWNNLLALRPAPEFSLDPTWFVSPEDVPGTYDHVDIFGICLYYGKWMMLIKIWTCIGVEDVASHDDIRQAAVEHMRYRDFRTVEII